MATQGAQEFGSADTSLNEDMYDPVILNDINLENWSKVSFSPSISVNDPGVGLCIRPLRQSDYERGYVELLGQLTKVGDVSQEQFSQTFQNMKKAGTYYVTVIEDTNTGAVIGSATLFIEHKFIHDCGKRARVEDVVVSDQYRGKQLGKFLVTVLTLLANKLGCYKISLDCRDTMIAFYESLGYQKEPQNGNFLVIRF